MTPRNQPSILTSLFGFCARRLELVTGTIGEPPPQSSVSGPRICEQCYQRVNPAINLIMTGAVGGRAPRSSASTPRICVQTGQRVTVAIDLAFLRMERHLATFFAILWAPSKNRDRCDQRTTPAIIRLRSSHF